MNHSQIIEYYENCEGDYRLFWSLNHSLAMHAGYWDSSTNTLREALANENKVLAQLAKISPKDQVLDAGCGIGGSAIFLAEKFSCRVKGITLSSKQALLARHHAQKRSLDPMPEFIVMDYCQTSFEDHSFDIIWALESVCHAMDKTQFLKEAYRLLKPSGRIVVADGFLTRTPRKDKHEKLMKNWLSGWSVNSLEYIDLFQSTMKEVGFKNVIFKDATTNIMPSSRRLFWIALPASFLSKIGEFFHIRTPLQTRNIYSAFYQHLALKKKLWTYGIFYGEKGSL